MQAPKMPRSVFRPRDESIFEGGFDVCPRGDFGVIMRNYPGTLIKFKLPLVPGEHAVALIRPKELPNNFPNDEGQVACTTPTLDVDPFAIITHASEHSAYMVNMRTHQWAGTMFSPGSVTFPKLVSSRGRWTAISCRETGASIALFSGSGRDWALTTILTKPGYAHHPLESIALNMTGDRLATITRTATIVDQIRIPSGQGLPPYHVHRNGVESCAYTREGIAVALMNSEEVLEFGGKPTLKLNSGGEHVIGDTKGLCRQIRVDDSGRAILRSVYGTVMWAFDPIPRPWSSLRTAWAASVSRSVERLHHAAAAAPPQQTRTVEASPTKRQRRAAQD